MKLTVGVETYLMIENEKKLKSPLVIDAIKKKNLYLVKKIKIKIKNKNKK